MTAETRFATADEVPELVALINTAFQVEKFFKIGERTDENEVRKYMEAGRFLVLPHESGQNAAGLTGCVYVEPRGPRGYLGMLSVAPGSQRQGVGTKLMAAGEEFLRETGCRFVEITVVDLRTELPPLYEKFGYRVTGTEPFPSEEMPVSRPCCFVRMSKPLMGG